MSKLVDIQEFAKRVERLCDFLLDQKRADGGLDASEDILVLQDLKEDAADISTGKKKVTETLTGLSDFMKGF